jgi:hypothetical protein
MGLLDLRKDLDVLINYDVPREKEDFYSRLALTHLRKSATHSESKSSLCYTFVHRNSDQDVLLELRSLMEKTPDHEIPQFMREIPVQEAADNGRKEIIEKIKKTI